VKGREVLGVFEIKAHATQAFHAIRVPPEVLPVLTAPDFLTPFSGQVAIGVFLS